MVLEANCIELFRNNQSSGTISYPKAMNYQSETISHLNMICDVIYNSPLNSTEKLYLIAVNQTTLTHQMI